MRIVSWNIQFGIEAEQAGRELRSVAELRAADIVLLQEMDEEGTAHIAEALAGDFAYSSAAPHDQTGRDFGNAVISPWPIRERHELPLPHQAPVSGQPRMATHVVVDVGGVDVSAYSVHTEIPSLRLARRIEQFDTIAADVRRRGRQRVVVAGDFNTVTTRGVRALTTSMAAAGLERISPGEASYRRLGRDMTLDHAFGAGFEVLASGVIPTTAASDHLPIWIELHPIAVD